MTENEDKRVESRPFVGLSATGPQDAILPHITNGARGRRTTRFGYSVAMTTVGW